MLKWYIFMNMDKELGWKTSGRKKYSKYWNNYMLHLERLIICFIKNIVQKGVDLGLTLRIFSK